MKRSRADLWVYALVLLAARALAQEIRDPLEDFASTHTLFATDRILRFEADMDGDADPEIFLSLARYSNARAGNIWTVYVPEKGGYRLIEEPISIRADAMSSGWNDDLQDYALLTYWPSADGDTLVAFRLDGERIVRSAVPQYLRPDRAPEIQTLEATRLEERGIHVQLRDPTEDSETEAVAPAIEASSPGGGGPRLESPRPPPALEKGMETTSPSTDDVRVPWWAVITGLGSIGAVLLVALRVLRTSEGA